MLSSPQSLPAAGRALQRAVLRDPGGQRDHGRCLLVGKDACQVSVAKAAIDSAPVKRRIDTPGTVKFGEVNRLGHLAADPLRALGSRLLKPPLRAIADRQELPLLLRPTTRLALKRAGRPGQIVLIVDARPPRRGQRVAGDLPCPWV